MFEFLIQHQFWSVLLVLAVLSTAACAAHFKRVYMRMKTTPANCWTLV